MCNNGPQRGFDTYSPSIVTSFGFGPLNSNALAAVGLFLQIPVSYAFSYVSDHWNKRGETVIAGLSCHLLGYIFNRIFTELKSRGPKYFGVVFTQTFGTFSHPLNIAWMSLTCTDSEERALAMAMVIMGANIAGIYGAQIFRKDDNPKYRRGFSIGIAVLAVAVFLATIRYVDDLWRRRRAAKKLRNDSGIPSEASLSYDSDEKRIEATASSDVQPAPILIGEGGRLSISGASPTTVR